MKKGFPLILMVLMLTACGSDNHTDSTNSSETDKTALVSQIEALETFFRSQEGKVLDKAKANELVEKSQQFVAAFPNDPQGAAYLFRAGEVARALGHYEDAIVMMSKVQSDYPSHERAAPALFLKGFTYEENLRDVASAKKYYQEFLKVYPDHKLAEQVKQLLAVVDTSPEELIKRFKKQEQQTGN